MPLEQYSARLREIANEISAAQSRVDGLSQALIGLGIGAALFGWWLITEKRPLWYASWTVPAGLILVEARRKAVGRLSSLDRLKLFYETGTARLHSDWDNAGEDGV